MSNLLPLLRTGLTPNIRNGYGKMPHIMHISLTRFNLHEFRGSGGLWREGLPANALVTQIIAYTPTMLQHRSMQSSHGGLYDQSLGQSATLKAFDLPGLKVQLSTLGPDGQIDIFGGSSTQAAVSGDAVLSPFATSTKVVQCLHDNFIGLKVTGGPLDMNGKETPPTVGELGFIVQFVVPYNEGHYET